MLAPPQLLLTRPVKSTNCVCALSLSCKHGKPRNKIKNNG